MTRAPLDPRDTVAINAILVSSRQAIDVICDRWSLALVVAALLGECRFGGLMARTGMASRLLTARLRSLEDNGVLMTVPISIRPPRGEYRLTNMGVGLFDVVLQMIRWEQLWPTQPGEVTRAPIHRVCGRPLRPELRCRACGGLTTARDIELKTSPVTLRRMPPKQSLRRRSKMTGGTHDATRRLLGASLDIFGDKWGIEVLLCAFSRVRRFNDFRASTGISTNILADRLARLVKFGVLRKAEGEDGDVGYRLTPSGLDLYGVMVTIQDWADFWLPDRYRSPVRLIHRDCGEIFHPLTACAVCETRVLPADVDFSAV